MGSVRERPDRAPPRRDLPQDVTLTARAVSSSPQAPAGGGGTSGTVWWRFGLGLRLAGAYSKSPRLSTAAPWL